MLHIENGAAWKANPHRPGMRMTADIADYVAEIERLQGSGHLWRSNMQDAWSALHMIRETIETLGPPGILPSQEAVLKLHGPEPVHEATVIVEALQKLFR